jgi:hypothetical protein
MSLFTIRFFVFLILLGLVRFGMCHFALITTASGDKYLCCVSTTVLNRPYTDLPQEQQQSMDNVTFYLLDGQLC